MAEFRVSERADADLLEIYLFGVASFGRTQAIAYQFELEDCFAMLARHPRIRRTADAVRKGLRRYEHKSHVILYKEGVGHVLVAAVLHGRAILDLKF